MPLNHDRDVMEESTPLLQGPNAGHPPSDKLWRKLDRHVIPVVTTMILLGSMDRGNIGNAVVAGLLRDLGMSDSDLSVILTISWIPYIASMMPATFLLKRYGADVFLPACVVLSGLATIMQGFATGAQLLILARFLLGLFSGGVLTCISLYISSLYPRNMLQLRKAVVFCMATLAGALSGLLAAAISKLDNFFNRPGWAWIFIIEGIITVAFGCFSFGMLPRSVDRIGFISSEERHHLTESIKADKMTLEYGDVKGRSFWEILRDAGSSFQVWMLVLFCFFGGTSEAGLHYFEPIIIRRLGYSPQEAQLLSVPPFALACILSLISGYISDRYQRRGITAAFFAAMCAFGFIIFFVSDITTVRYLSLYLAVPGSFCAVPAVGAWTANNIAPYTRRGVVISLISITSSLGGFLSPWILGSWSTPPKYTFATVCFVLFSTCQTLCALANLQYVVVENRKKALRREQIGREEDEEPGLGDRSAWFIYSQ